MTTTRFAGLLLALSVASGFGAGAAMAAEGDGQPPAAVPSGADASVAPLTFPIAAMSFAIEPTVADVSMKQEGKVERFTLAADVLFDFDKAELKPEADAALRKFLGQLGPRAAKAHMRIEGHTDGKGTDAYNDALAMRRARSVEAWIASAAGLAPSALSATGFGKQRPVVPNVKPDGSDDPDGRQRNRRVEIVVQAM